MAAAAAASGEYGPKQSVNSDGIAARIERKQHVGSDSLNDFSIICIISRIRANNQL